MSFPSLHRPKRCAVTGRTSLRTKLRSNLIRKLSLLVLSNIYSENSNYLGFEVDDEYHKSFNNDPSAAEGRRQSLLRRVIDLQDI